MIHSYPKVWNMGHPNVKDLFNDQTLVVEEKIDGSQFSFRRTSEGLEFRSKKVQVHAEDPHMFSEAVKSVQSITPALVEDWIYRCEFLRAPKHNTLTYGRVPAGHLVLWDVETSPSVFLRPGQKLMEAERLGLEPVPMLTMMAGDILSVRFKDKVTGWLDQESVLGGAKIEGVVVKNYTTFGNDGKILAAKHVSEAFKETHQKDFKKRNPSKRDLQEEMMSFACSEARWNKAIHRLRDENLLEGSPKDIGKLIAEIKKDVEEECEEEIKEFLWKWARPHLTRGAARGFPEFYKRLLLDHQFD